MDSETNASPSPLLAEEAGRHPALVIGRLREEDPVHWIPGLDAWFVTRHEDVGLLFADARLTPDSRVYERYQPPGPSAERWLTQLPFIADGPDQQTRGRRLVTGALTSRAVNGLEDRIREVVEQFAEPLRGRRDVVDLVGELVRPIPGTVIGRITGVPPKGDDEARFRSLARKMVRGVSPILDDRKRDKTEQAITEMCDYVSELVLARERQPGDDLISDLLAMAGRTGSASTAEIVKVVAGLVSTGTDTVEMAGVHALRTLLLHPEALELLRRDRSLLPQAIHELLRYDAGLPGMPRYALEDFELRGKQIRKGQLIVLSFVGAHRDPRAFSDPDRLDLRRENKELLIFGHGTHYCVGSNLARTELRLILDAALDLLPRHARLLPDEIVWSKRGILSRIKALPVDFGA